MKISKTIITFFTISIFSLSTYGVEITGAQQATSIKLIQNYIEGLNKMHQIKDGHSSDFERVLGSFQDLFVDAEDASLYDEITHQRISLDEYGLNLASGQYYNITFEYQLDIANAHYIGLSAPNLDNANDAVYAAYSVPKVVYIGNKKIEHTELILIDLEKKKIVSAISEQGTKPGDSFTMALVAYNEKRYEEALRLFEATIVKQCSRQMKGCCQYYAGIMYYKKQGCDSMKRADRDKKSYQLLLAAESNGIFQARLVLNRLGAH